MNKYIAKQQVIVKTTAEINWFAIRQDLSRWAIDRFTDLRCILATVIQSGWRFQRQIKRQACAIGFAIEAGIYAYKSATGGFQWQA